MMKPDTIKMTHDGYHFRHNASDLLNLRGQENDDYGHHHPSEP